MKASYKKNGMFEGASPLLFERAKQLRREMTAAETVLWMHLKKGIKGLKFRRQHPFGIYIADFYCHKIKLVIEIDGSIHQQSDIAEYDKHRQKEIEAWGYTVIRFSNEQVMTQIEKVILAITQEVTNLINNQKQNAST